MSSWKLIVCLGDFNAVPGSDPLQNGQVLGPYGSGVPNDNSERLLACCRNHRFRIGGPGSGRKQFTDCHVTPTMAQQRRRLTTFSSVHVEDYYYPAGSTEASMIHSDHRPVVAELLHRVKKIVSAAVRAKRYDVRKLEYETMAKRLSQRISDGLAEAHYGQSTTASQS